MKNVINKFCIMIIYTKLFKMALMVMLSVNAGCIDNDTIILNDPQIYDKIQLNPWLDEYFIEDKKFVTIQPKSIRFLEKVKVIHKNRYDCFKK